MTMARINTTESALAIWDSLPIAKLAANPKINTPSQDLGIKAIAGCLNKNNGKWRATPPKEHDAKLLWKLVKFHRSTGNLHSWPWFAPKMLTDQLDTLAIMLLDGRSNAASNWQRVLGR
jgi:hypothetical protein